MASPQIHTARDPSGGSSLFNKGWGFVSDKVFNKGAAGTAVKTGNVDAWALSIAGFDLWSYVTIDQLYAASVAKGAFIYYMSLWRNPPNLLGTGIDYYRIVVIAKP